VHTLVIKLNFNFFLRFKIFMFVYNTTYAYTVAYVNANIS